MGRKQEEHLLPGIEYEAVLALPPSNSIVCLGIVESIADGRRDLPISDSDWASFANGEDGSGPCEMLPTS